MLYRVLKYLPPPSARGETFSDADWDKVEKGVSEADIRKAIHHGLPDKYKIELERNSEIDWKLLEDSDFLDKLTQIEERDRVEYENLLEERAKIKQENKRKHDESKNRSKGQKSKASSSSSSTANTSRKYENRNDSKYCHLCELAGAPDWVCKTHNADTCKKRDQYKKQLTSSTSDKLQGSHKKQSYAQRKIRKKVQEIKELQARERSGKSHAKKSKKKKKRKKRKYYYSSSSSSSSDNEEEYSDSDSDWSELENEISAHGNKMVNLGSSVELNKIDKIIKANQRTFNDDYLKSSLKNDFEN